MEIKQLEEKDTQEFCDLIVDMYSHLENLEWFTPMPYDYENVSGMIKHPRFYIIGAFENGKLCGVSSLDYKCGKLIGKVDFPKECNTASMVEIGFNLVHSTERGKGIMKLLVAHLLEKIKNDGFEWAMSKVHKDNFASSKSLIKNGFKIAMDYVKPVNKQEFKALADADFFSPQGKENAAKSLAKSSPEDENIIVNYDILLKEM